MTLEEMKQRKKELGYTYARLSELSGVPLSTVQKIFGGATTAPRYDTMLALESLLVTRPMVRSLPRQFRGFTPVSALAPGVLAATGMEALELLRGAVQATGCAAVIAVDALAARSRERLCATVQLGDTGLIPGSGVGNHRKAIDKTTLGVPVVAVGVPTVIAAHLLGDGQPEDDPLFLTPRDIDGKVRELGRVIGYGVTLALQEGLSVEDVTGLLG